MGEAVRLIDSAEETARTVAETLASADLLRRTASGKRSFFVTDVPTRFEKVGGAFLGADLLGVEQIELDWI